MIERFGLGPDAALEDALLDLAKAVTWPETPDLAGLVGARLRSAGEAIAPASGQEVRSIGSGIRRRPLRRAILLAAALLLALVGAAAAVRLGLQLLEIDVGPAPSSSIRTADPSAPASAGPLASAGPGGLGAGLGLGAATSLADARSRAGFPLRVPALIGSPDTVILGGPLLRGQIAFLYASRTDLPPASSLDGAGLLVTQNRGEPDERLARKLVTAGAATVEPVTVDGAPGYWIAGPPHMFWYLTPDGEVIEDSRRSVGDTLVWERDGILYRIEGAVGRDRALEIAASMR